MKNPKHKTVPNKQFNHQHGPRLNRIWDHVNEVGLAVSRVDEAPFSINDVAFIFVRDDGWSIGATPQGYSSAYDLWAEDWVEIIEKEGVTL